MTISFHVHVQDMLFFSYSSSKFLMFPKIPSDSTVMALKDKYL